MKACQSEVYVKILALLMNLMFVHGFSQSL